MPTIPTVTKDRTAEMGRWALRTSSEANPRVFVSSVDLYGSGIEDFMTSYFGNQRFETIMHDENGWRETPEGYNAYQYDSQAECEADRPRILAMLFGEG